MEKEGQNMRDRTHSIEEHMRERDPQFADFWESVKPRILTVTGGHWTILNPIMHDLYNEKNIKNASEVTDEMIRESHAAWLKKQEVAQASANSEDNPANKGWV